MMLGKQQKQEKEISTTNICMSNKNIEIGEQERLATMKEL
jgi:hypothetical protein